MIRIRPIPGAEHPPDLLWLAERGHHAGYGLTADEAAAALERLLRTPTRTDRMLTPYPTSFTGPVAVLLRKYRGEEVPFGELAHAGWDLAGYALSQVWPDASSSVPALARACADAPRFTDGEMTAALERLQVVHSGMVEGYVIPWRSILKTLLPYLLDLLG